MRAYIFYGGLARRVDNGKLGGVVTDLLAALACGCAGAQPLDHLRTDRDGVVFDADIG